MSLADDFLELLRLQRQEDNLFIGKHGHSGISGHTFGGQVLAQALSAAYQTVTNRECHALNCLFLSKIDAQTAIHFHVDRIRDGKSFSTRRVHAVQKEQTILSIDASFQTTASGFEHQSPAPKSINPEELFDTTLFKAEFDRLGRNSMYDFLVTNSIFEFRFAEKPSYVCEENSPPRQQMWFRSKAPLANDPSMLRILLAYLSDLNFVRTCSLPYLETTGESDFQLASLNHSLWIHHTPNLNEWLLFDMHSPIATGNRALVMGQIYNQNGDLIATAVQEGLLRQVDPSKNNSSFSSS